VGVDENNDKHNLIKPSIAAILRKLSAENAEQIDGKHSSKFYIPHLIFMKNGSEFIKIYYYQASKMYLVFV